MSLQREHELVRSGGTISRHVMAIAFGLVLLAIAIGTVVVSQQEAFAATMAIIGGLSVAWGTYRWLRLWTSTGF